MSGISLHYKDGKPVLGVSFYEAINGRLKQARNARELTQKDLSKLTGLSVDKIRILEKHHIPPDGKEILILCHHLEVTPNWIYYGTDNIEHAKHIQNNLLNPSGYIDTTDQLIRMALFFSVLTPNEKRALEIVLTSMVRGSGRSDEDIKTLLQTAGTLTTAFSNNPFLNDTINELANDPDLINKINNTLSKKTSTTD
jgi:transcriptional regulator with XRE-family HTH domain